MKIGRSCYARKGRKQSDGLQKRFQKRRQNRPKKSIDGKMDRTDQFPRKIAERKFAEMTSVFCYGKIITETACSARLEN
ncbi:MAG: hypothetical protein NC215_09370 [Ruminococcus sp.]|nr:hypothetical protein [Ruminococcus sp.]